jgi:hypothetical protein
MKPKPLFNDRARDDVYATIKKARRRHLLTKDEVVGLMATSEICDDVANDCRSALRDAAHELGVEVYRRTGPVRQSRRRRR